MTRRLILVGQYINITIAIATKHNNASQPVPSQEILHAARLRTSVFIETFQLWYLRQNVNLIDIFAMQYLAILLDDDDV